MRIALAAALMLTAAPLLVPPRGGAGGKPRDDRVAEPGAGAARAGAVAAVATRGRRRGARYGGAAVPPPTPYQAAPPAVAGGDQSGLVAQLLDRVSRLEDQSRQMRGTIDELQNELSDRDRRLSRSRSAIWASRCSNQAPPAPGRRPLLRLRRGQRSARCRSTRDRPRCRCCRRSPAPQPTPAAPRTPELAIRAGYAALARGDYPTAESDAREVLARGSGPRTNDAQYLLARSLNAQRNWRAAAVAYDDAYNAARTGPHAQESLLGLANALVAMGDNSAACGAIARLRSQFPTPRADLRRAVTDASSRAGCR